MARSSRSHRGARKGYLHATQRPLNSLVLIVPLLVAFHVGTLRYGSNLVAHSLVGDLLGFFGATFTYLPPILIVAVLVGQQWARRDGWKVQPGAVIGMVIESAAYALPLVCLSHLVGPIASLAAQAGPAATARALPEHLLMAVGAGIYEEFVFRLVLVGLGLLVLVDALELHEGAATVGVILAGGVLFGAVHFSFAGLGGDKAFAWGDFLFLSGAGAFWGVLYAGRGFGVAVGTHILWDLYVLLMGR